MKIINYMELKRASDLFQKWERKLKTIRTEKNTRKLKWREFCSKAGNCSKCVDFVLIC